MIGWKDFAGIGLFKKLLVKRNAVVEVEQASGANKSISADELSVLDGITATAAEINATSDISGRLITLDATSLSLTAATHGERIVLMSHTAAASTLTLPAASGSGTKITCVVGAVNTNNHIIKVADATDIMHGQIITCSTTDTPDLAQPWPTAADSDTITLNGTTQGGQAIGDTIQLIDIASNKWHVLGFTTTSGVEATPFSATVA